MEDINVKIDKTLVTMKGKPYTLLSREGDILLVQQIDSPHTYHVNTQLVHEATDGDIYKWLPKYGDLLYDKGLITWGTQE